MNLQKTLEKQIKAAIATNYDAQLETVEFQATRKDFEGDITVVVFPILRVVKGNPVVIGEAIGDYLVENVAEVVRFNVVKGFLNLVLSDAYYLQHSNSLCLPHGVRAIFPSRLFTTSTSFFSAAGDRPKPGSSFLRSSIEP